MQQRFLKEPEYEATVLFLGESRFLLNPAAVQGQANHPSHSAAHLTHY